MGFVVFGFMLGIFAVMGAQFALLWFLLRRANKEVFGRFLQGVAALVTQPESEKPAAEGES